MIRRLALVATTGLIGAVAFLTLGIGLAEQNFRDVSTLWGSLVSTCGPSVHTTHQVALSFDVVDNLEINLPAIVRYQPGPTAELVISGDQSLLDHVEMEGGKLTLNCDPGWPVSRLDVLISGPAITSWKLNGNVELALLNIDQSQLRLGIRGNGSVTATGAAESVDLDISGSGKAILKGLVTQSAKIDIRGNGDAQITAKTSADVSISGSGNIELFGNAVLRRSEIRGSGHVTQLP
ncbi:GIN domain-containing protein [Agrobacterium rosae]